EHTMASWAGHAGRRTGPNVAADRTVTPRVLGEEGEPHNIGIDLQQADTVSCPIQVGWNQKAAPAQKVEHLDHYLLVGSDATEGGEEALEKVAEAGWTAPSPRHAHEAITY